MVLLDWWFCCSCTCQFLPVNICLQLVQVTTSTSTVTTSTSTVLIVVSTNSKILLLLVQQLYWNNNLTSMMVFDFTLKVSALALHHQPSTNLACRLSQILRWPKPPLQHPGSQPNQPSTNLACRLSQILRWPKPPLQHPGSQPVTVD